MTQYSCCVLKGCDVECCHNMHTHSTGQRIFSLHLARYACALSLLAVTILDCPGVPASGLKAMLPFWRPCSMTSLSCGTYCWINVLIWLAESSYSSFFLATICFFRRAT